MRDVKDNITSFVRVRKYYGFFLLSLLLLIYYYPIWDKHIFFTDELMIEDISYGMAHGSGWIVPTLHGAPYFVKPPLLYWLTALLYYFLPPYPWIVRLWMPIFGVLLVVVTYQLAALWCGKKTALWSALILATSNPLIYFTKAANFDLLNTLLITLTIYFYNLAKRNNFYLSFVVLFLSLAVLNRSFLGLLPIGIIIVDNFISSEKIPASSLLISFIIFFCIILPWHLLAYIKTPQFFISEYLFFPIKFNMLGIFPGEPGSSLPPFVAILVWFPWIIFLLFYRYWYAMRKTALLQILIWCSAFLFLFIAQSSKEWYLLMCYPILAITAGSMISEILRKMKQGSVARYLITYIILILLLEPLFALIIYNIPQAESITAVQVMEHNSNYKDSLYVWKYSFFPVTRFFPYRRIFIVNGDNINDMVKKYKITYLLIRKVDIPNRLRLSHHTILYQTQRLILFQFI